MQMKDNYRVEWRPVAEMTRDTEDQHRWSVTLYLLGENEIGRPQWYTDDHAETYLPPDHTQEYANRAARELFPQAFLPRMRSIEGHNGRQVDDETAETILGLVRNRVRIAPGDHQSLIVRESLYEGGDEGIFVVEYEIDEYPRYAVVAQDDAVLDVEDTTVEVHAIQYYEHLVRDLTTTADGPLWETTDVADLPEGAVHDDE